ncbi:unnamed protein product, partial [Onchocerca flexuosa]|uniref:DSPn domain-containing protein n=1 Tax=Onchocerca flexuosa TaxID=387005 RepID=A0A183HHG1_9BILA
MAREHFIPNSNLHGRVAEIIPKKLFFCAFRNRPKSTRAVDYYYVDDEVHYDSFYSDFGPLNLSVLYRFCQNLTERLEELDGEKFIV